MCDGSGDIRGTEMGRQLQYKLSNVAPGEEKGQGDLAV